MTTITTINNKTVNNNEKLYKATVNGSYPMNETGTRLFNKGVDRSLIVFPEWQRTETSNDKKIRNLARNLDLNLMPPIILVAHPEEYRFICPEGWHRYCATEMRGIDDIPAIILFGPADPAERELFEIDLFLKQSISTETVKAIQMHKARLRKKDPAAMALQELCDKYGIDIVQSKGQRSARVLGSYDGTYSITNTLNGKERLANIFKVLEIAGYMEEANGLSSKIMVPIDNICKEYPFAVRELGEFMRTMSPNILAAKAVASYPERGWRVQLTLYLQDWVTDTYHVEPRYDGNGKVIKIA